MFINMAIPYLFSVTQLSNKFDFDEFVGQKWASHVHSYEFLDDLKQYTKESDSVKRVVSTCFEKL